MKYVIIDSKLQICDKSFQTTPQGYLMLDAIIARSGPQEYLAHELGIFDGGNPNRIIMLDRPAEEVTSTMSIESFVNMPVTDDHPQEGFVTPNNFRDLSRGMVLDATATEKNQVRAKLLVQDAELIKKIKDGKHELSAGYEAEIEFSDDGKSAIQKKIRGNHVAFVDAARCGKECSIFDSVPKKENPKMAKVKIKDAEYEVADEVAPVVASVITDNKALQTNLSDTQEQLDKTQALLDAANEKVKEMEDEEEDEEEMKKKIGDAAQALLVVLKDASKIVKDYDATGKSIEEIKRDVVCDSKPELKDKSQAYIDARFDAMVDAIGSSDTLSDAATQIVDADGNPSNIVADARAKKMARGQAAYKGKE